MGNSSPTDFYAKKFGIRTPFVTVHSQMTDRGGNVSMDLKQNLNRRPNKNKSNKILITHNLTFHRRSAIIISSDTYGAFFMTKEKLIEYALTFSGAAADSPFEDDFETVVLRHSDTGKWFGLIMLHDGKYIVNLKCEPLNAEFLRDVYKGVIPAYHMNKIHWNSVYLDSDVPDEEIFTMVGASFELTQKKRGRTDGRKNRKRI